MNDGNKLVDDISLPVSAIPDVVGLKVVVGLKSDLILILLSVLVKCNELNDGNKLVDDTSSVRGVCCS